LVKGAGQQLKDELEDAYRGSDWLRSIQRIPNPFGEGDAGTRIAQALKTLLDDSSGLGRV
jgi:UDP-N-acetylglucosamine 2-epimerase